MPAHGYLRQTLGAFHHQLQGFAGFLLGFQKLKMGCDGALLK